MLRKFVITYLPLLIAIPLFLMALTLVRITAKPTPPVKTESLITIIKEAGVAQVTMPLDTKPGYESDIENAKRIFESLNPQCIATPISHMHIAEEDYIKVQLEYKPR